MPSESAYSISYCMEIAIFARSVANERSAHTHTHIRNAHINTHSTQTHTHAHKLKHFMCVFITF